MKPRRFLSTVLFVLACSPNLAAAELIVLAAAERSSPVHAIFRTSPLATGTGNLSIEWTDTYGRVVERRTIPVELNDESDIGFDLDLRRAEAMQNQVHAHLVFDGHHPKGDADHREQDAQATFIAKPPVHSWWDYAVIMWQNHSAEMFGKLKELGINGSEYGGRDRTAPEFLLKNDLRWYAENIATDFYSSYHHYFPDRDTGWEFKQARAAHQKDPASLEPFKRHPSLTDAAWLTRIRDRVVESARFFSPYRPFFYSLGDETGVGELEAAWDFDFSDESLVPMRDWLRQHYGTLARLNAQWGSNFTSWNEVTPMTTDQAMKRGDDNFSAWADFKEWMDICYANALKLGTDAVHSVDPEAYVGIGGGQMPGWGGYDYSRIVKSLTAIEPYDIGNNIEIIRSLNPAMVVLTTAFAHGPWEQQRVWYELLHGNRGLILWDDKSEYVNAAGESQPRGRETSAYYNELRNGVGALLINSQRQADPIAIHYSQPSMRVEWMLESRPRGGAWSTRTARDERTDNNFMRLRESWCRLIEDSGLQYKFVSYDQVEQSELLRGGFRVLILPHSSSLSALEAQQIHDFVAQGGVAIADGDVGTFDQHGRRLKESQLGDVFGKPGDGPVTEHAFGRGRAVLLKTNLIDYHRERVLQRGLETRDLVARLLRDSGISPAFKITGEDGKAPAGVELHQFKNGDVTVLGLLSNPDLRVDELGPPDFQSNEHFARKRDLKVTLPEPMFAYDVRANKVLGSHRELTVQLEPYEPVIYALSRRPQPHLMLRAPDRTARGETAYIGISLDGAASAQVHIVHLEVTDPSGRVVSCYSGNLRAPGGYAAWAIPVAYNDLTGKWNVRAKDVLTGDIQIAPLEIY